MRAACAILLLAALAACAPAPATRAPLAAPGCPEPAPADAAGLLRQLPGADYGCAESIAAALAAAPQAPPAVGTLLAMARPPAHARARRNALRALGRLAEAPAPSPGRAAFAARAADVRAAALAALAADPDDPPAAEAIWLLDTALFPEPAAQPRLEALSADPARTPELRARAINAASRLILSRPGPASQPDLAFALRSLAAADPGVRARAALILERWRDDQLDSASRALAVVALADAWSRAAAEPLLPAEAAAPGPAAQGGRFDPLLSGRPDIPPPPLAARAAVARALDRLVPGGRLARLRQEFERAALTAALQGPGVTIRAGLPPEELPALLAAAERARAELLALLGPAFQAPLPGEPGRTLTMLVFAGPAAYQAYAHAFLGFGAELDGLYVERDGALYTYARPPSHSAHTLAATIAHEVAHAVAGRHVFPGTWHDPGYHAEPKGWADEGLAELVVARALGQSVPPPAACPPAAPPSLAATLARRAGYDRFGTFAYHHAHALVRYLLVDRPAAGRAIYAAFRAGTYRLADAPALAGAASAEALEADWHAALGAWCAQSASRS